MIAHRLRALETAAAHRPRSDGEFRPELLTDEQLKEIIIADRPELAALPENDFAAAVLVWIAENDRDFFNTIGMLDFPSRDAPGFWDAVRQATDSDWKPDGCKDEPHAQRDATENATAAVRPCSESSDTAGR